MTLSGQIYKIWIPDIRIWRNLLRQVLRLGWNGGATVQRDPSESTQKGDSRASNLV